MARVLVIGDRPDDATALAFRLGLLGHESTPSASDQTLALRSVITFRPDIVALDARRSKRSRELFQLLYKVSDTPIIVLTGEGSANEAVRYLEAGASDCMARLISPNLLSARIMAILRSSPRDRISGPVKVKDLEIDPHLRLVRRRGKLVSLTPIEFRLLEALAGNLGKVCTHGMLLSYVWGKDFEQCSHYLRLYIGYLRHKLEDDPRRPDLILTTWGRGYRLGVEGEATAQAETHRLHPAVA
jgi:two-component system KDP operon response regulator KdpE